VRGNSKILTTEDTGLHGETLWNSVLPVVKNIDEEEFGVLSGSRKPGILRKC